MSIFTMLRTQNKQPLTLEQQHNAAAATHQAAVSVFKDAIGDIRFAADLHQSVAEQARAEQSRLAQVEKAADSSAESAHVQADKLAGLFGV